MDIQEDMIRSPHGFYGSHNLKNTVGYCNRHHLALTVNTLKKRNCLGRGCRCLTRHEEHDYWRQREQKKEMRRARKARLEEQYERIVNHETTDTAEEAQQNS